MVKSLFDQLKALGRHFGLVFSAPSFPDWMVLVRAPVGEDTFTVPFFTQVYILNGGGNPVMY